MSGVLRWNNANGGMRFAFPPYGLHPAGQDQGLGPGPALGQTPGHQELV